MYACLSHEAHLAYKFTGKERDTESGLDMFGARYYGSSLREVHDAGLGGEAHRRSLRQFWKPAEPKSLQLRQQQPYDDSRPRRALPRWYLPEHCDNVAQETK